jgi:hypothetical protein
MADKKISALTASTTPLAGTEVLPIVQSGATVQVSVANLTAGRAISATSVTASTGNFVVGTSGQGVDFSATPGTGTSELLADYEEGTFTATLTASVTAPTTPVTTTATYTKVGRLVTVQIYFDSVDTTGAAGDMQITGLPFTIGTVRGSGVVGMSGFGVVSAFNVGIGTILYVAGNTTATGIPIVAGAGKFFYTTISYQV